MVWQWCADVLVACCLVSVCAILSRSVNAMLIKESRRIISKHALVWDGRPVWVFVQLEGYFSWILSSHPWLQGKPSQLMGSPGSPGSPASLLKNCSGEASPFPPALAVVVSPGLKDVVDKMEGSSGPTKFLGLFDSSFWIQKCKKQSPSKGKGSPRNMRTSPKTYRMCWDAAVS